MVLEDLIEFDDKNKCPLKSGTVLLRKVYDEQSGRFVDDKTTYKVQNGAIVTSNGEEKSIMPSSSASFFNLGCHSQGVYAFW